MGAQAERWPPATNYTRVGEDYVAYQVAGGGGPDLLYMPQWFNNVEAQWDVPPIAQFVERLAGFARVLMFDKRGTGLSDPASAGQGPFLEQFADDVIAVLDASGTERATIVAGQMAGLIAVTVAVMYPDRVAGLVLINSSACLGDDARTDGAHRVDVGSLAADRALSMMLSGAHLYNYAPSLDPALFDRVLRFYRMCGSPRVLSETHRVLYDIDLREMLGAVHAPTLVLHHVDNQILGIHHGRVLASHIPSARLVELRGGNHVHFIDPELVLDEIELFTTGERRTADSDRVVATILFADLVSSTESAAAVGDRRWRSILDLYDFEVRRALDRFRGRHVKSIGDGTLATFDGPGRAVLCARAIRDAVARQGLAVRVGLHTGEIERRGQDVAGIGVHLAQRVEARAQPNEVWVSRTVVDLVAGSDLVFDDRGEHELKGIPGVWHLFALIE